MRSRLQKNEGRTLRVPPLPLEMLVLTAAVSEADWTNSDLAGGNGSRAGYQHEVWWDKFDGLYDAFSFCAWIISG